MSVDMRERTRGPLAAPDRPAPLPPAPREESWFPFEEPHRNSAKPAGVAAACSLLAHIVLFLLMATILFSMPRTGTDLTIESALGEDDGVEQIAETPAFEVVSVEGLSDSIDSAAAIDAATQAARSDGINPMELAGGALARSGGEGPQIGFFGTRAGGATFAFVVDSSGSMRGKRFERACAELKRSLRELQSWQQFAVVFYNDNAIPLFYPDSATRLYPASRTTRNRAYRWISRLQAGGSTEPAEALQQALDLRPDVIFFLTDGEIPPEARAVVQAANRYNTIVHTIAFESREGEAILKAIAYDNKGRYRYVE